MNYLLDTCFLSELYRQPPNPGVAWWIGQVDEQRLYIPSLSLGEIQKGVAKLAEGRKKQRIQSWLDQDLRPRFAGRILPIDDEVALEWGVLLGAEERDGRPRPVIDSLIAATAMIRGLTLVTRNSSDFEALPIQLFNPWE